jgi:hypothetical protein
LGSRIVVDSTSVCWGLTGFEASTLIGTVTRVPQLYMGAIRPQQMDHILKLDGG